MNGYKTAAGEGEASFTERKSRFIGYISNVANEDEAKEYIAMIRELHPESSHVVWCYIFKSLNITRASDDGEPSGTAGRPVSEVLLREELTDVVCCVVRYFGGILLGAGGLIRAYAQGAKAAVDAAGVAVMLPRQKLRVTLPYHYFGKAEAYLKAASIEKNEATFGEDVSFCVSLPPEQCEAFEAKLGDITAGRAKIKYEEIGYFAG